MITVGLGLAVAKDSEKLDNQLPVYYAKQSDLDLKADDAATQVKLDDIELLALAGI